MDELGDEIERLEGRLARTSAARSELVTIRRGIGRGGGEARLPNIRIGFACKERWEDMVGDDRVRACGGCDRPVFNLSAMTRAEAEALLATRGLTPCVRFYRRPDGTVMTSDCPTASRRDGRRLAFASSFAGATLAAMPAMADPSIDPPVDPSDESADPAAKERANPPIVIDQTYVTGIPIGRTFGAVLGTAAGTSEVMGEIIYTEEKRPTIEWSVWTRAGAILSQPPAPSTVVARGVPQPIAISEPSWEFAATADLTVGVSRHGNLRVGAWGEVRSTSDPVGGAELVLENLPPHPYASRIDGSGSLVLRAGANDRIITGAFGFGYIGSWPRSDPWVKWARHVVGARLMFSVDRAIDDTNAWSATIGLEIEPLGVAHAVLDRVTR